MGLTICLESKNDLVVKKDLICQDNNKKRNYENINELNDIIEEEVENLDNKDKDKIDDNLEKKNNNEIKLKSNQNSERKNDDKNNNEKKIFFEHFMDKLSVNNIIPEQKLHSKNNNEIMFIGDLEKIEGNKIFPFFSTLTRLKINFYDNKSQFISMKKPNYIIELKNIKNADLVKENNNTQLLLCISLIENDEKIFFKIKTKELLFKWLCVLNYFIHKSQM